MDIKDISKGDIVKPDWSDNEFFLVTAVHYAEGGIYGKDVTIDETEIFISYSEMECVYKKMGSYIE